MVSTRTSGGGTMMIRNANGGGVVRGGGGGGGVGSSIEEACGRLARTVADLRNDDAYRRFYQEFPDVLDRIFGEDAAHGGTVASARRQGYMQGATRCGVDQQGRAGRDPQTDKYLSKEARALVAVMSPHSGERDGVASLFLVVQDPHRVHFSLSCSMLPAPTQFLLMHEPRNHQLVLYSKLLSRPLHEQQLHQRGPNLMVNMIEYFMFMFARFPVSRTRGNNRAGGALSSMPHQGGARPGGSGASMAPNRVGNSNMYMPGGWSSSSSSSSSSSNDDVGLFCRNGVSSMTSGNPYNALLLHYLDFYLGSPGGGGDGSTGGNSCMADGMGHPHNAGGLSMSMALSYGQIVQDFSGYSQCGNLLSQHSELFILILSEIWLKQNHLMPPQHHQQQQQQQHQHQHQPVHNFVYQHQGGGMSSPYNLVGSPSAARFQPQPQQQPRADAHLDAQAWGEYIAPTHGQLQAIIILMTHVLADPLIPVEDTAGAGSSPALSLLTKSLFDFLRLELVRCPVNGQSPPFALVAEILLLMVQPWWSKQLLWGDSPDAMKSDIDEFMGVGTVAAAPQGTPSSNSGGDAAAAGASGLRRRGLGGGNAAADATAGGSSASASSLATANGGRSPGATTPAGKGGSKPPVSASGSSAADWAFCEGKWRAYVIRHYHFFTTLFLSFLRRARELDWSNKSDARTYLSILERFVDVYNSPSLLALLRQIDATLLADSGGEVDADRPPIAAGSHFGQGSDDVSYCPPLNEAERVLLHKHCRDSFAPGPPPGAVPIANSPQGQPAARQLLVELGNARRIVKRFKRGGVKGMLADLSPGARVGRDRNDRGASGGGGWFGGVAKALTAVPSVRPSLGGAMWTAGKTNDWLKREERASNGLRRLFDIPTSVGSALGDDGDDRDGGGATTSQYGRGGAAPDTVQNWRGFLTPSGKSQVATGQRKCRNVDVEYLGDEVLRPICSYELGVAVRLSVAASRWLNEKWGLPKPAFEGISEEPYDCGTMSRAATVGRLRSGFRFNLRFLADVRNMLFALVVFMVLHAAFL